MQKVWIKVIAVSAIVFAVLLFCFFRWWRDESQTRNPPRDPLAICEIFKTHPDWYRASYRVEKKYGAPISLQMAIVYQESRFRSKAEPKRQYLFGWLPWLRESTAEGYSQALDDTWHYYLEKTGKLSANREYFSDSVEFIGWYLHRIHHELHIPMSDTYSLYMAYHEGIHGYVSHHHLFGKALRDSAFVVERVARHYHERLIYCEKDFVRYR